MYPQAPKKRYNNLLIRAHNEERRYLYHMTQPYEKHIMNTSATRQNPPQTPESERTLVT